MNFSTLTPELSSFFATSSYNNYTYDDYAADLLRKNPIRDGLYVVIPLTLLYAVIFVSGVVGNVITCVVIHKNRNMHTATNYYLFSLAVSDLLLLFSGLPHEIYKLWYKWPYPFNEIICILQSFASETSANATVLTITAFTVERYVAICKPFLSHTMSKLSRAVRFILAIWILAMCLSVPQVIDWGINTPFQLCMPNHDLKEYRMIFTLSTVLVFVLPMTVITILYILIALQLRQSVVKRGNASGSSVQLKHKIFKNQSTAGNKAVVTVNTKLECHHSNSILTCPKTQPPVLSHPCYKQQQLIRQPSKSSGTSASVNNNNSIDQLAQSLTPEEGRINFSKKQSNHGTKHVVKMLVAVVLAFFICWAPFHVQRLLATYAGSFAESPNDTVLADAANQTSGFNETNSWNEPTSTDDTISFIYYSITNISGVLYFISTCINPFLYNIMSNKFREAFKDTIASYLYRRSFGQQKQQSKFSRTISVKSTSCNSHSANTCSSSHSLRYLEADLARMQGSKRPLVVSFKRIPTRPLSRPQHSPNGDNFTLSNCNYCNALHTSDHHQQHPAVSYHQQRAPTPPSPYETYHRKKNANNKSRLAKLFFDHTSNDVDGPPTPFPHTNYSRFNENLALQLTWSHQQQDRTNPNLSKSISNGIFNIDRDINSFQSVQAVSSQPYCDETSGNDRSQTLTENSKIVIPSTIHMELAIEPPPTVAESFGRKNSTFDKSSDVENRQLRSSNIFEPTAVEFSESMENAILRMCKSLPNLLTEINL